MHKRSCRLLLCAATLIPATAAAPAAATPVKCADGDSTPDGRVFPEADVSTNFLLLPDPTEEFDHPYGLQNYAVTYTGYTLLQNMLRYP